MRLAVELKEAMAVGAMEPCLESIVLNWGTLLVASLLL